MAINPETQYPGKIEPASTEFPYGKARNITVPSDGTGTPFEAALVNDLFGFQQALLKLAAIVPSGTPDEVGASQYLDSLLTVVAPHITLSALQAKADNVIIGNSYRIEERTTGNGGGAWWRAIAKTTENGFDIVTGSVTVSFQLIVDGDFNVAQLGAVGAPTDETAIFTHAATLAKYINVPSLAAGYNVADTVVGSDSQFIFLGRLVTTQLVGTATRHHLNGMSIHNGIIAADQIRIEPEKNTLTATNEGTIRGIFTDQAEPDLVSVDYGDAGWNFNEINCQWRGTRTGSGPDGGPLAAKCKSLQVNFNGGGTDYALQSAAAIGCGYTHNTADNSIGDKLGLNAGVTSSASTLGKLYGISSAFTVDSGGDTPQAIGNEVDCFINGTGVCINGLGFNAWAGGDALPSNTWAAYAIGKSGDGSAKAWRTGIMLYTAEGIGDTGQPIRSDGDLFDNDRAMTLANIFNFTDVTVTGNILDFPNCKLTGDGDLILKDYVRTVAVAVASLPSAATVGSGARAFVFDALTPAFGVAVTGGSSTKTPVYSDGAIWLVG